MDFHVFGEYWKRIFGNKRRMLVKKTGLINPH